MNVNYQVDIQNTAFQNSYIFDSIGIIYKKKNETKEIRIYDCIESFYCRYDLSAPSTFLLFFVHTIHKK